MKIGEQLREAAQLINSDEGQLASEVLMRHILRVDRTGLYLAMEEEISPEQEAAFWGLVKRLKGGEALAYIIGHKEFYGVNFLVTPDTLIPRPETELVVDKVIELAKSYPEPYIADIGTGSGAIAISLALALPQAKIIATDISSQALMVANKNSQQYHTEDRVTLLEGDLLSPLPGPVDIIVANLPYVKSSEIPPESCEPKIALDGGEDGLELIGRLVKESHGLFRDSIVIEIGQGQQAQIEEMLTESFPGKPAQFYRDLNGIERLAVLSIQAIY